MILNFLSTLLNQQHQVVPEVKNNPTDRVVTVMFVAFNNMRVDVVLGSTNTSNVENVIKEACSQVGIEVPSSYKISTNINPNLLTIKETPSSLDDIEWITIHPGENKGNV